MWSVDLYLFYSLLQSNGIAAIGSGDTFMAALLTGILSAGKEIEEIKNGQMYETVDFANAAGALCATKTGSMLSMPYENDVNECRKRFPKLKAKRM